jgi:hypothetical protein
VESGQARTVDLDAIVSRPADAMTGAIPAVIDHRLRR